MAWTTMEWGFLVRFHSVVISYNRLSLTKQVIESYIKTSKRPISLVVVDNASTDGTPEWLMEQFDYGISLLNENRYPGPACNIGWSRAPADADFLHRADNDFAFKRGWQREVLRCFEDPNVGQVGLRTDEEENHEKMNVGGNCVIRRELWDKGLRYDERPWPEYPTGYSEDSFFSPAVVEMGYTWTRVQKPCIVTLASGDMNDPYHQKSYGDRGIEVPPAVAG